MGAWDKFFRSPKGNGERNKEEHTGNLNATNYTEQLKGIYEKTEVAHMELALKGMKELEEDVRKEQEIKIAGAKSFQADIIRDLESYLSIAENLEIENLDVYRKILKDVESIQTQGQVSEKLENELNKARESVDQLKKLINNFLYGKQNDKGKQEEADQPKKSKTSDETIKETGRNTDIVEGNKHKNTPKPSIIGNTEIHSVQTKSLQKQDREKEELMREERNLNERMRENFRMDRW